MRNLEDKSEKTSLSWGRESLWYACLSPLDNDSVLAPSLGHWLKALCRWLCRPRETRTTPSCYCLLTKGFATQSQGKKHPGTPSQGWSSKTHPALIPHMGILHPRFSSLLFFFSSLLFKFLNAREAVKPLMFPGVLLQCLYLHTPTCTQPTQGAPHLQAAWCVLPKGQLCISTHPPGPSWSPKGFDTCHLFPTASIHFSPGLLSIFSLVSNPILQSH